ncbi:thioesterase family protein [Mycobacterium sp. CVI_P3]|uniref:Thioesterase family protein n=1 Tax=Mycobacterium pinniadriaticum TaxID=2994102 RepID=A0ABT3S7S2_9MYCO|nr:acyl-CoA thioesterase domain-containing protein [Mycobacterium pinniadriaticum]MCX2929114.1 thioesterase family protein [Mycobacterium pinniadriaticum]MCX2935539.1 thioesterase family protein [Mycobacterium pinniadriaticum]
MSVLAGLLDVTPEESGGFVGAASGPADKRAYGGHLAAQALAAACRTVDSDKTPTSLHVQFLRGGDAGVPVHYFVEAVYDGRTAASRRVLARQDGRLLTTTTVSFSVAATGPEHAAHTTAPHAPADLPATGPIGPAPSLPLDEIDIRTNDDWSTGEFVRRLWWRVTVPLCGEPWLSTCAAAYVTDIYGIDPVLAVHGHSMTDRSHRTATTDSSIWFHRPIRAGEWNLLESRSPAAARGRGLVTLSLYDSDKVLTATLVQEGLAVLRT